ncbi:uncharacterized protein LOC120780899 [Bactrocera tryoni]|uniref:uncharacterized protein LOC120780899 n=1 Tax=Bactrocera tryoni TaxID=59916 RepID=UPI001A95648C|nr:uncharacterized protein LOC120780899 [Bactrocera tryoni]
MRAEGHLVLQLSGKRQWVFGRANYVRGRGNIVKRNSVAHRFLLVHTAAKNIRSCRRTMTFGTSLFWIPIKKKMKKSKSRPLFYAHLLYKYEKCLCTDPKTLITDASHLR